MRLASLLIATLVAGPALMAADMPAPTTAPAPAAAADAAIKFADLPAAVKKTCEEKHKGGEPSSIEKKVVDGKTHYVFTVKSKKDGEKHHTLVIGEDGKLLKNEDKKDKKDKKDK